MYTRKIMTFTLVIFLLAGNIILGWGYFVAQKQNRALQSQILTQKQQGKSLLFLQTFIQKVIRSEGEVSFETRLKLENEVRDLGDDKILAQWQAFVNSQTEAEAQKNVKALLGLLTDKAVIDSQRLAGD
ncbi:MAG: hypothetical protein PHD72_04810 [Patescibacteria group bacterium]|nr:hypothetical protein [Patescibacteria group bacterium]